MSAPKNLFLAGTPGVGKTTMIKEVTLPFRQKIGGFYTEQVVEHGVRIGFRLVTFEKEETVFASKTLPSKTRVNKYGIDVEALDRIGVKALERARTEKEIIIIDEIGTMEMLSEAFQREVLACLSNGKPVLATIRRGAHAFMDTVLRFEDSRLVELERRNYDDIKREVQEWLKIKLSAEE